MTPRPRPDAIIAGELAELMDGDRQFDLFSHDMTSETRELLFLRPTIVSGRTVIWGFRYRHELAGLGTTLVPILRCDPEVVRTNLLTALSAEGRQGSYRWAEIDRVIGALEGAANGTDVGTGEVTAAIDPSRDILELLRRYRRLALPLQRALDDGEIDIRTAEMVPEPFLPRVEELLRFVAPLSFSDRRRVLRMLIELARRGDIDVAGVIDLVSRHNGKSLTGAIHRLRYPRITALETALSGFRERYTRGSGVEIALPDNYEGDALRVSFTIRSATELERRVATLRRMKEEVDDLVGLLF